MLNPNPARTPPPAAAPEGRPAPHNIEAEQALLGALLCENSGFERIHEIIGQDHFYDPLHARIFETIALLISGGKLASPITLKTTFEDYQPITPTLTVVQYLGQLAAHAPTISGVRDYAETIVELSRRRSLIILGEDVATQAYEAAIDSKHASGIIEDAEKRLFDIAERASDRGVVPFRELMVQAASFASEAFRQGGRNGNIESGFVDLDKKLGGLRNGHLVIVAGRPSMGKTAFATNIAFHVARNGYMDKDGQMCRAPVGFFSLEMGRDELARRMLSSVSKISDHKVQRGLTSELEVRKIEEASREISNVPMIIDDRGGIQISQLTSRARRMKRRHGIQLLVVDYLQLLSAKSGNRNDNRVQEITEITTGLKAIAKELEIPVIALSQLSRKVEEREDKRPQLADLRESGSIEQDADVVVFMYREAYYLSRTEPPDGTPEHNEWVTKFKLVEHTAEAIIGKQRHGPIGTVDLRFNGELTLFENLANSDRALIRRSREAPE